MTYNFNELVRGVDTLDSVEGIARRGLAGLQALANAAAIGLDGLELVNARIGSAVPGQYADHGAPLWVAGQFTTRRGRAVEWEGFVPSYQTVGGRAAPRAFTDGDEPLALRLTVSSATGDDESTFIVAHGVRPWEGETVDESEVADLSPYPHHVSPEGEDNAGEPQALVAWEGEAELMSGELGELAVDLVERLLDEAIAAIARGDVTVGDAADEPEDSGWEALETWRSHVS